MLLLAGILPFFSKRFREIVRRRFSIILSVFFRIRRAIRVALRLFPDRGQAFDQGLIDFAELRFQLVEFLVVFLARLIRPVFFPRAVKRSRLRSAELLDVAGARRRDLHGGEKMPSCDKNLRWESGRTCDRGIARSPP